VDHWFGRKGYLCSSYTTLVEVEVEVEDGLCRGIVFVYNQSNDYLTNSSAHNLIYSMACYLFSPLYLPRIPLKYWKAKDMVLNFEKNKN